VIWNDPFLDALEPSLAKFRDSRERRISLELLRALRLAPTLEVCEAILENPRSVPVSKLDPKWAKAYGIK